MGTQTSTPRKLLAAVVALLSLPLSAGAVVAPDQSLIAFSGGQAANWQLYSVRPDGGGLTGTGLAGSDVHLQADLSRICFEGRDGRLYLANRGGTGLVSLPVSGSRPKLSPDGTQIAFLGPNLSLIGADGSGLTDLGLQAADFDWSPGGLELVFSAGAPGYPADPNAPLYGVHLNDRSTYAMGWQGFCPRWSPSGKFIAFGVWTSSTTSQLVILDAVTGTLLRQLPVDPLTLDWSPDESQLVFASASGSGELFLVNADGTGTPRSLGVAGRFPSWAGTADLSIATAVTPLSPDVGDSVTLRIRLSNAGPHAATNIEVKTTPPPALASPTVTAPAGTTYTGADELWRIPSLAPGAHLDLNIVGAYSQTGPLANVAEVIAVTQPDPDSTPNNHVLNEDDLSVTFGDRPSLIGSKKELLSPGTAVVLSTVTYRLTVHNSGAGPLTNVVVRDVVPAGLEYVADSATVDGQPQTDAADTDAVRFESAQAALVVQLPQLLPNVSKVIEFRARVAGPPGTTVSNAATVTTAELPVFRMTTPSVTVTGADLSTSTKTCTALTQNADAGLAQCTITVRNTGNRTTDGLGLADPLPDCLEYVPGSLTVNGSRRTDAQDNDDAELLPAGTLGSTTATVRVRPAQIGVNGACVVRFQVRFTCPPGPTGYGTEVVNTAEVLARNAQPKSVTAVVPDSRPPRMVRCSAWNLGAEIEFSEDLRRAQVEDLANWTLFIYAAGASGTQPSATLPLASPAVITYTPAQSNPARPPRAVISGLQLKTGDEVEFRAPSLQDASGMALGASTCRSPVALMPGATLTKTSGGGQTGTAGQALAEPLVVTVATAGGQRVPGVGVRFAVQSGSVQVAGGAVVDPAPASGVLEVRAVTDAQGQARALWVLGPQAGRQELTVTADGDGQRTVAGSPATFAALATPGTGSRLTLATEDASVKIGGDARLTVAVLDEVGNGVPGQSVSLAVTPADGQSFVPAATGTTDAAGRVRVQLNGVVFGPNRVTATAGNLTDSVIIRGEWRLSLPAGLNLFTLPFRGLGTPEEVLGMPAANLRLAVYDAAGKDFVVYPDSDFPAFEPGRGFFGLFRVPRVVSLTRGTPLTGASAVPVVGTESGWQTFANPFPVDLRWSLPQIQAIVDGRPVGPLSGLIRGGAILTRPVEPYLWILDPADAARPQKLVFDAGAVDTLPTAVRSFVRGSLPAGAAGWGFTKQPRSGFLFPAPAGTSLTSPASTARAASAADGWSLELLASAGDLREAGNVLGVGASPFRLADPPAPPREDGRYLTLSLDGHSPEAPPQAVDVRAAGGQAQTWSFAVRTNVAGAPVTLSWPDLGNVPSRLRLYLIDTATGASQALRTTSSYTFRSETAGATVRRFTLEAHPAAASRLQISNLAVTSGGRAGGLAVTYTLSHAANVTLALKSAAGRVIQVLGPQATRAGLAAIQLPGRSATGAALPRGAYLVDLTAEDDQGHRTRAVRPVMIR